MATGPPSGSDTAAAAAAAAAGGAGGKADGGEAAAAAAAAASAAPATAVPGPLRLVHTLTGHTRAVAAVKLSPVDADLLASGSADATVRLWRLGEGREVGAGPEGAPLQHGAGVNDVAWNPHGTYLATVADDTLVRLWDAETGALLRTLPGHTNYAYCCQFDPAGRMLVRDLCGGRLCSACAAHLQGLYCRYPSHPCPPLPSPQPPPLTPTQTKQATGSFDETIRFWDVRTGRLLRETPAHSDPVTALSFSFDGTLLVSGSFDGLVRVWDARNGHCLRSYASSSNSAPVNDVALSHNGALLGV
jgi:COMPASS component SWD3